MWIEVLEVLVGRKYVVPKDSWREDGAKIRLENALDGHGTFWDSEGREGHVLPCIQRSICGYLPDKGILPGLIPS
jgi:hypothetical protein